MYDFHIHSEYSMDSNSPMDKVAINAIEKKAKAICFTDHIDFDATVNKIDIQFRVPDYFKEITKMKYKYKDKLDIFTGVEIGMQPHLYKRYDELINKYPFDFVIMSIHTLNGIDIASDKIFQYATKDPEDIIMTYYETMLDAVKQYDNFDVLGHIDYIDRYFERQTGSKLDIKQYYIYEPIIEEILKVVIDKNKGIELNTAGLRTGLDYYNPKINILKLYKSLGGEIITMGSDAHHIDDLLYDFKKAERLLKQLGFKNIYIYRERKKIQIQL